MKIEKHGYFTKNELRLWLISAGLILVSFALFGRENVLLLTASLIGVTSLIFNAKGNPVGQFLMVVFSVIYGIISYGFAYYGEMITYVGMSGPMAAFSLISWLKHPFHGNLSEVKINHIRRKEISLMFLASGIVTWIFYYILRHFNTANLIPSTISVTTSFLGVYLTFRRSEYYALGYAANDVVLIILWVLASMENLSYVSMIVCFVVFLINDLYGFFSWRKMRLNQAIRDKRDES